MKITDVFTLFHRSNPPPPTSIKGGGVKPVSEIDKMTLQPGQLFRGEVLGEDGQGNLLLKMGGEIITTRGLTSMATGQQIWVEVKEVGDSPLFTLASAKGAVHELLKNIMDVRPALLTQGGSDTEVAPEFQRPIEPASVPSFVPKLDPLAADGSVPRETRQLLSALLSLSKAEVVPMSEEKTKALQPLLNSQTGQVDVGKVAAEISQSGKLPPVLREFPSMRPLFIFSDSSTEPVAPQASTGQAPQAPQATVSPAPVDTVASVPQVAPPQPTSSVAVAPETGDPAPVQEQQVASAKGGEANREPVVPFITEDGKVVSHTVQFMRTLVAAVELTTEGGTERVPMSGNQAEESFSTLVRSILDGGGQGTESTRQIAPISRLFQGLEGGKADGFVVPVTVDELLKSFADTGLSGKTLSAENHNETVVKVLAGLQGETPRPDMLRVLKQLVSLDQPMEGGEDDTQVDSGRHSEKHEAGVGLAKAASFFHSQAMVNHEVAQVSQGDCVLIPCFFAGQSGWGEWMWSQESGGDQEHPQENLAFFLEMSNLGPISIQAILGENSVTAQFRVADDTAYGFLVQGLPDLEKRLESLGYDASLSCQKRPVAVMKEMKDALEIKTSDLSPTSLVDIQA